MKRACYGGEKHSGIPDIITFVEIGMCISIEREWKLVLGLFLYICKPVLSETAF